MRPGRHYRDRESTYDDRATPARDHAHRKQRDMGEKWPQPQLQPRGEATRNQQPSVFLYLISYILDMKPVRALRHRAALTQPALASAAGTSQPTIAAYEAGGRSPTLRTLEQLANAAGFETVVDFVPKLTREERRSIALHRAIAVRLTEDPDRVLARARRTLGRMKASSPSAAPLLREWSVLLDRPLEALLPVLTDPSPWARELRQVTPFAGVLSARERAGVYRSDPQER